MKIIQFQPLMSGDGYLLVGLGDDGKLYKASGKNMDWILLGDMKPTKTQKNFGGTLDPIDY